LERFAVEQKKKKEEERRRKKKKEEERRRRIGSNVLGDRVDRVGRVGFSL